MTTPDVPQPLLLDRGAIRETEAEAVLEGAVFAPADVAVTEVSGPGAITCLQGLLTNDLDRPGDGGFGYGALLTPKGMILSDLWVERKGATALLVVPRDGKAAVDAVLRRSMPPRLARATDRPEITVWRLAGPKALDAASSARMMIPEPGRAGVHLVAGFAAAAARPRVGPFMLELRVETDHAAALRDALVGAGVMEVSPAALEMARILGGWPRLGAEIDAKTLPQEVRFDENEGVSYTKGCYTGQETVARVHFRGHVNRFLAGLAWVEPPALSSPGVEQDGAPVGWVTSAVWLQPVERYFGLAKLRRETDRSRQVTAAGGTADIVELPFGNSW